MTPTVDLTHLMSELQQTLVPAVRTVTIASSAVERQLAFQCAFSMVLFLIVIGLAVVLFFRTQGDRSE